MYSKNSDFGLNRMLGLEIGVGALLFRVVFLFMSGVVKAGLLQIHGS